MPIYEYQCSACGHSLELLQKVSDEPREDCPACQENTLKKQISAPVFRLKGGGWYETDFKSGDKKNLASDSNSAPASDKASPGSTSSASASSSPSSASSSASSDS